MTKRTPLSPIELNSQAIERCESRLAFSASLCGELLLQSLGIQPIDPLDATPLASAVPQAIANDSNDPADLFGQARTLRDSMGLDGAGQTVVVIDSGIAWDHVALGGGIGPGYRVVGGWDFAENDDNPYDDGPAGFHGTHVAGVLAGSNGDFAGIAPGADIVGLRVFDDNGAGRLQWIESALQWVYTNRNSFDSPITTVNLSVGAALTPENFAEATTMLEDELRLLRDEGILVFAASGNLQQGGSFTQDSVLYPASSSSVVAVSSIDATGSLSPFAQRESGIFAARGQAVSSSVPDHVYGWDGNVNDFASLSGTSMASPQIAGASMLVRQAMIEQGLTPTADEILERLTESSQSRVDASTGQTYRIVDLEAAVAMSPGPGSGQGEETGGNNDGTQPGIDDTRWLGTSDGDVVTLDFNRGVLLRSGQFAQEINLLNRETPFVVDAANGSDSLVIIGSPQAERLIASPPGSTIPSRISNNDGEIELRGFEQIEFRGGGGPDRATLYDSPANDTLTSRPGEATLTGVGFRFEVSNVPRVFVHATAGGDDAAFMHDSAGDDQLVVRPQFTSLRSEETFQLAYGFERVFAYATTGNDVAELYDSAGDDVMSISSGRAMISGVGYQVSTRGFSSVVGIASEGGDDIARIYADASGHQWHRTEDLLQWTGANGNVRIARGFERSLAFEDFEPIELIPSSLPDWLPDLKRNRDTMVEWESRASRAVFEALGE